jgi:sugar lactone lactonase YvrE
MLRKIIVVFLILAAVGATGLYLRYGGGESYRDLNTPPVLPASALEIAAQYPEPIGNIAVSVDGRLFFTVHPESRPETNKLMEWRNGKAVPFPDAAFQATLKTPLGLAIDGRDRLWVIDHGMHGATGAELLSIDLKTNTLTKRHPFERDIAPLGSFLQDLRVSPDGNKAVIADVSFFRKRSGLIVHDIASGKDRRVLDGHASVTAQDWIIRTPSKDMMFFGGLVALKPGVDGLTITADGRWVYYAAMAHDSLFRVPLAILHDPTSTADAIAAKVERVGAKPLNDGLSSDLAGNVLLTDVEHQSVVRWRVGNGKLETLIRDPRIRWADGLSHGPDGWLYLADSAIPEQMLRSKAHIASQAPYTIWRFKTDSPGVPGQ